MMFPIQLRFYIALILLAAPIVSSLWWAIQNDWFFPLSRWNAHDSAEELFPGTTHFFEMWSHWGWRASIPLAVFLAWAFAESWPRWNGKALVVVILLSSILAVAGMIIWAKADNDANPAKHVLSAFAINGRLTFAGWCLAIEMALTYTIAVMYFVSPGPMSTSFPFWFATALTVALAVGLLQPPYYVWGKIHGAAWGQTLFFGAAVWVLFFTHKLGYVIHT